MSPQSRYTAAAILLALIFANSSSGRSAGSPTTAPLATARDIRSAPGAISSKVAAANNSAAKSINVTVDVLANRHAISPYVYGGSYPKDAATISDRSSPVSSW